VSGRPLLAASLAFVGGVALGAWLPQERAAWGWASAGILALWAALLVAGRLGAASRIGLAAFVVLGIHRLQGDLSPLYAGHDHIDEGDAVVCGRIARPAELREGEVVLHLEDARLRRNGSTFGLSLPLQVVVTGGGHGYAVGDRVTARGKLRAIRGDRNLGWFPGPVAPFGRRCAARLVLASPAWIRRDGHDPGRGPNSAVLRWRAAADAFWKAHPGAAAEILNSLTTGERAGIPREVQSAFLRAGLTHLLAISGMNVGFLAAMVFLLLRRVLSLWEALALRFPVQPVAAALTLPALWFFMLFSGSQIPVGRAVLMSAAGLAAVILWRRVDPGDALALSGLAIVAWDPRALFSASFQLSFAAVAALALVAPRVSIPLSASHSADGLKPRLYLGARSLLIVSLAASAATAPLVAFHFQQLSIVGPLANLVAVPLTGFVVLPAGWLALGAAAIWDPAGEFIARLAVWSAGWLVEIAEWFASPSWASIRTARPPALLTLCLLAALAAQLPRPTNLWRWAAFGACAAAALAGTW
jgi:competence protein ComEC